MTDLPLPDCLIDYPADTQSLIAGGTAILTYNAMPVSSLIECIESTQGGTPVADKNWVLTEITSPCSEVKSWALNGPDGVPSMQAQPRTLVLAGVTLIENVELRYVWTEARRQAEKMNEIREKVRQVRHG